MLLWQCCHSLVLIDIAIIVLARILSDVSYYLHESGHFQGLCKLLEKRIVLPDSVVMHTCWPTPGSTNLTQCFSNSDSCQEKSVLIVLSEFDLYPRHSSPDRVSPTAGCQGTIAPTVSLYFLTVLGCWGYYDLL